MGCGASTSNVAKPGTHGGTDDHKKKDTQTTYRERLGEDFIIDFAKSQDNIKDLGRRRSAGAQRSPNSSAASGASTLGLDDLRCDGGGENLISPYTTPPKTSLPRGIQEGFDDRAHEASLGLEASNPSSPGGPQSNHSALSTVTTIVAGGVLGLSINADSRPVTRNASSRPNSESRRPGAGRSFKPVNLPSGSAEGRSFTPVNLSSGANAAASMHARAESR